MANTLKVGDVAPDFTAIGSDGHTYRLAEMIAYTPVFLVFYPGNDTPG